MPHQIGKEPIPAPSFDGNQGMFNLVLRRLAKVLSEDESIGKLTTRGGQIVE